MKISVAAFPQTTMKPTALLQTTTTKTMKNFELTNSLVDDGDRGSTERPSYFLMVNGLADKVFVALGFLYSFGKVVDAA